MLGLDDQRVEFRACSATFTAEHPAQLRPDRRHDGSAHALRAQVHPGDLRSWLHLLAPELHPGMGAIPRGGIKRSRHAREKAWRCVKSSLARIAAPEGATRQPTTAYAAEAGRRNPVDCRANRIVRPFELMHGLALRGQSCTEARSDRIGSVEYLRLFGIRSPKARL